jgi:Na+/proline symporter
LTLWWKKTTGKGVLAGMVAGTLTTIIWSSFTEMDAFLSSRLIAWMVAFLAVFLVSLSTEKKVSPALD